MTSRFAVACCGPIWSCGQNVFAIRVRGGSRSNPEKGVLIHHLMGDDEWAIVVPFLTEAGHKRGRTLGDHRRVLDGIFWIARTGTQWRDLTDHSVKWESVSGQSCRWPISGTWELRVEALNDIEDMPRSVQMINNTIVRAPVGRLRERESRKEGDGHSDKGKGR